jgi:hypothetical protein
MEGWSLRRVRLIKSNIKVSDDDANNAFLGKRIVEGDTNT